MTEDTTPVTLDAILAPEGTGTFTGGTTEEAKATLAENTATVGKTAVAALRAEAKAADLWRTLAALVMAFRATVQVTHEATGKVGPDWEAKSDLAKRWTSYAITAPITKANANKALGPDTKALVLRVQKGIENVLGRKVPGSDSSLTLRETIILAWITEQNPEATEEDRLAGMRAQFANLGRKTSAEKTEERATAPDNPAGPQTVTPPAPTVALTEAVDRVLAAEADSAYLILITEATRLVQRAARQNVDTDEVQDRPLVAKALADLTEALAHAQARFDGEDGSREALRMYLNIPPVSDVITGAETTEPEPEATPEPEAKSGGRRKAKATA